MKTNEIIARAIAGHFGSLYDDLPKDIQERRERRRNGEIHENTQLDMFFAAKSALAALSAAGLVIVPRKPTEGMLEHAGAMEGHDRYDDNESDRCHIEWWQAMITAREQENE